MNKTLNDFERDTILNRLAARRKFHTVPLAADKKSLPYMNRDKQLAGTLKSMNVIVDGKEIARTVLKGLLSS